MVPGPLGPAAGAAAIDRMVIDQVQRIEQAAGVCRQSTPASYHHIEPCVRKACAQRRGEAEIATGVDFAGSGQTQITLDKAFIQFAGITAGRATSFFDFYSNDLTWFGITGSDRGATNLLAYTATFGGGWSATISRSSSPARRTR